MELSRAKADQGGRTAQGKEKYDGAKQDNALETD
jgi:hypothetical protein